MLLDDGLDGLLLEELGLVLLDLQHDLGAAAQGLRVVLAHGERAAGRRLPRVLLVVVALGGDGDLVGDQVGRVEAHAKLSDHADVGTGRQRLHEGLGARLGDCSQVVDEVRLGHADAGVDDGEGAGVFVRDDLNVQVLAAVQLGGVGQRLVADLV